jgi:hypothetical protein
MSALRIGGFGALEYSVIHLGNQMPNVRYILTNSGRHIIHFEIVGPKEADADMQNVLTRLLNSLTVRHGSLQQVESRAATRVSPPPRPQVALGTPICPSRALVGSWADSQVTSSLRAIDVSLTFNADGSYTYFAGQGNAAWVTHTGVFQISEVNDQRYRCKVTLTPNPETVKIASQAHLFLVQSRDLMDDKERTFLYKFFPNPNRLMLAGTWTDWHNDVGTIGLDRR